MAGFSMGGSGAPQVYNFINQSNLTIQHGIGYKPQVYIIDASGNVINASVTHLSNSRITIHFVVALSGSVYLS